MVREELKWQNIDADDLPAAVKKSFDAMVEAEATWLEHCFRSFGFELQGRCSAFTSCSQTRPQDVFPCGS
jgi:hypothetical protein